MSYLRLNPDAGDNQTLNVPKFASVSAMPTRTTGTDAGTFTGLALAATLSKVAIDGGAAVDITPIALADGTGLAINPAFAAAAQRAIAEVMIAAGYTDIDNLTVAIAIVDATPDTFTVTITHTGEATLTSVYIGADKTLTRT